MYSERDFIRRPGELLGVLVEVLIGTKHQRVLFVRGIAIGIVNDGEVVTVLIDVGVTKVVSFKDNHVIMKKYTL